MTSLSKEQKAFESFKLLSRALDRMRSINRKKTNFPFDPHNLSFKQLQCIGIVADWYAKNPEAEGLSLKELASMLDITTATASSMVDRLVYYKILERNPSHTDRRHIIITFTTHGKKNVANFRARSEEFINEMVNHMSDELLESTDQLSQFLWKYLMDYKDD